MSSAEIVQQAMGHPGVEIVSQMVREEIESLDAKLDSDRPLEHVEYAALHGRRSGLRYFEQVAQALVDRAAERLDEQRRKHEDPDGSRG